MQCSTSWVRLLTPSCFSSYVAFCVIVLLSFTVEGSNSSRAEMIYNLTICELNGTSIPFDYFAETYIFFPIATYIISWYFSTISYFLDLLGIFSVVGYGIHSGKFVLPAVYAAFGLLTFIAFVYRFVKNIMSWRYACTRFTNFVISTKGKVYPWKSPIIIKHGGRAEINGEPVDIKTVVQQGSKAQIVTSVQATQWQV